LAVVALTAVSAPAAAQDFKVIVNAGVNADILSAAEIGRVFLKQSELPNTPKTMPVDQAKSSPVRAAFSQAVLGRSVTAVDTYWQQQIFAGKDTPPAAKPGDDEVVAYVKATPGAIGYVSSSASTAGVKVVTIK
jgi:ABC-type phosphate transport system substrate-binding protein